MNLIRSETMDQCQMILPKQSAQIFTKSIGDLSIAQFNDLNAEVPSQKRFQNVEMRVCNETIDMIEKINKMHTKQATMLYSQQTNMEIKPLTDLAQINKVQDPFTSNNRIQELSKYYEQKLQSLMDYDQAFTTSRNELDSLELYLDAFEILKNLVGKKRENHGVSTVSLVSGCILKKDQLKFQKTMLRISRNNAVVYFKESSNKKQEEYIIFVVLLLGQEGGVLHQRCLKAATSFEKAKIFDIPEQEDEQMRLLKEKETEQEQKLMLYSKSINMIISEFRECARTVEGTGVSKIEIDKYFAKVTAGVYDNMNKQKAEGSVFIAEAWVPQVYLKEVNDIVEFKIYSSQGTNKLVPGEMKVLTQGFDEAEKLELNPPTYFRQNEMTAFTQMITDTQGVPRQKEINPTLFNCVTFPMQFGVMFGDIFHGTFLFIIALFVVAFDHKLQVGGFKWFLLQMGFWAMFMGWMYNDFTGLSLDVFGTCYKLGDVPKHNSYTRPADCQQPFGFDPVWARSSEEIAFANSQKMKLAIVLGVCQMVFGVFLKGFNTIQMKNKVDFFFEFIPQIIFINAVFGWMCFLIVYKWTVQDSNAGPWNANLITTMINMGLAMGKSEAGANSTAIFDPAVQTPIQFWLFIVAIICVPIMLLVKPIILMLTPEDEHKTRIQSVYPLQDGNHKHAASELFVHQMIETIEYVLGCVSNTASQLRLWALSLAHSQLAVTFFNQTFRPMLTINFIAIAIGFLIFMTVTIGVLMLMDALECFLHALRLHWVEFQNKFYKADGKKFNPYSHKNNTGIN